MPDPTPDDRWLERLRADGTGALAALHAEHHSRLERLIRFRMAPLLAPRLDPVDVLQDAYLEAQRRLPDYLADPRSPPFVWLRYLTVQAMHAAYRRHVGTGLRSAEREVPLDTGTAAEEERLHAPTPSPEQAVILAEVRKQVAALLDGLDDINREVLALRHFEGLTNEEVAAALDLKKSTASHRYVRALRRLRAVFEPPDEGGTAADIHRLDRE